MSIISPPGVSPPTCLFVFPNTDDQACSHGVVGFEGSNDNGIASCRNAGARVAAFGDLQDGSVASPVTVVVDHANEKRGDRFPRSCLPVNNVFLFLNTDDQACSKGVVGFEGTNNNGIACCPIGCPKCGGSGCGVVGAALGFGSDECCCVATTSLTCAPSPTPAGLLVSSRMVNYPFGRQAGLLFKEEVHLKFLPGCGDKSGKCFKAERAFEWS